MTWVVVVDKRSGKDRQKRTYTVDAKNSLHAMRMVLAKLSYAWRVVTVEEAI